MAKKKSKSARTKSRARKSSHPKSSSKRPPKRSAPHKPSPTRAPRRVFLSPPKPRRVIRAGQETTSTIPPWLLELKDPRSRKLAFNNLVADVKALRQVFTGFETVDGYDLRHVELWSQRRVVRARKFGVRLRNLKSYPHIIVRPRTAEQRAALFRHVSQPWKNLKAFVVHTPRNPERTVVQYVMGPPIPMGFGVTLRPKLRVQLVADELGGKHLTQDFLFREILGYQPGLPGPGGAFRHGRHPWEDMIYATRMLLPFMPRTTMSAKTGQEEEAWYTVISMPHDSIGASIRWSEILNYFRSDYSKYDPEFAGLILGFRYQGDRWKAAMSPRSEMNRRDRWKSLYRQEKSETRKALLRAEWRMQKDWLKDQAAPPKPRKRKKKIAKRKHK